MPKLHAKEDEEKKALVDVKTTAEMNIFQRNLHGEKSAPTQFAQRYN
jgi:hypothetical protein